MPTPREGTPVIEDKDYTFHLTPEDRERYRGVLERGDYGTFEIWLQRGKRALKGKDLSDFLAEAAVIADVAGESKLALKYALEAAAVSPDDTAIRALVRTIGGDEALAEIEKAKLRGRKEQVQVELDDIHYQKEEAMKELNAIFSEHDFSQSGYGYSEEQRKERIVELRALIQRLDEQRAQLREELGLSNAVKK